jgi:hypothetical protein
MDTQEFAEAKFIGVELIKQSPSKKVYISGDAAVVTGQFGDRLELPVELDNKKKTWTLTRDHVKALQECYGKDSRAWVGQTIGLRVVNVGGKESVLAFPEKVKEEKVE